MTTPHPTTPNTPRPAPGRLRPRLRLVATALLPVLAALATSCGGNSKTGPGGPPPVPVTVGKVEQRTVPVEFRAIGHMEPLDSVVVRARIGGELQKVWFREGQAVRAGNTLFTIDARPYQAALAQAEALLARDRAQLAKAEQDVSRYADLVAKDFVTKEQYDQVTTTAAALRAAVAADEANVQTARLNVEYCTITAPVEGLTGNLEVKLGNLIKANDTALVSINRIHPILASFSVPAQFLPEVTARRGQRVVVRAEVSGQSGPAAEGELAFVDNAVDTATSTILLKATFANHDERLWPGQFVNLTVVLGEEPDRVVCPSTAVQTSQQGQYVFVVKDDATVEQRPVQVARMDERDAVVASGLSVGETVVTDGQLRLVQGSRIQVKEGNGGSRS